jgi:hypothetical protein
VAAQVAAQVVPARVLGQELGQDLRRASKGSAHISIDRICINPSLA